MASGSSFSRRSFGRASPSASALALVVALGACEDESFTPLTPALLVEGCEAEGPCLRPVDEVPAFGSTLVEVALQNTGDAPLQVEGAVLDSSSDPAFTVVTWPAEVPAGGREIVHLRFNPVVEGSPAASLVVRTDAANIPCTEETSCDAASGATAFRDVTVELTGQVVAGLAPILDLDKSECSFGRVGLGAEARCTVSVGNVGEGDLVVESFALNGDPIVAPAGSGGEVFVTSPVSNMVIAPGTRQSVDVTFIPDALGFYAGVVNLVSNDPDQRVVEIAVVGEQVDAPTCDIRVATVNGLTAGPSPAIEPLDDVVLSASESLTASAGAQIASVAWTFVERPTGSTLGFSTPGSITTGFTFADGVQGIDLAGHYRVAAVVTDTAGFTSTNLCEVAFDAVPSDQLLIQLGWETATGDMDLHVVRMDGGQFCTSFAGTGTAGNCGDIFDSQDCHFSNCTLGGLDWDGDGSPTSEGDPSLDIDDLCGYGPENITLSSPEPGEYLVAIHYWGPSCGGGGEVGNTVRVYTNGVLELESFSNLGIDEWWEAAIIHWPGAGGTPCVEPLDQPGSCG